MTYNCQHGLLAQTLYGDYASYFIGATDFFVYDQELAEKLEFIKLIQGENCSTDHGLSVCHFMCFAMTGKKIQDATPPARQEDDRYYCLSK